MIPKPREIQEQGEVCVLHASARIVAGEAVLLPLARQLAQELVVLAKIRLRVVEGDPAPGDIVLRIEAGLPDEAYVLDVAESIEIGGGDSRAVAWGTVTLLHALRGGLKDEPVEVPRMHIEDRPALAYRGLMVDLARQWHPIENVRMQVALCRWYKIRYLHLHLTDDSDYRFPTAAYPHLPTPDRHYTREQLQELEAYAQACGVTILPELDVPGHAKALLKALPDLVGCEGGQGGCDICPGRESTYEVMATLIGEMCDVFRATPYFHIGADESARKAWKTCPHCRARMDAEGLADEEELYRYFIIRTNEIVKQQGKQTIVWEGFGPGGTLKVPTDVAVMVFESDYHLAPDLLAAGYPVINTTWQPLYIADGEPGLRWPPAAIYRWNPWRWETPWERSPAYRAPIQIEPTPAMWGTQLCSWGQQAPAQIGSLRERLAAMSERAWAPERTDAADFFVRLEEADLKLSRFLYSAWPEGKWPFWIQRPVERLF